MELSSSIGVGAASALVLSVVLACNPQSDPSEDTGESETTGETETGSETDEDQAAPEIQLTWLGVTTWLLRYGETTVLLDTFFSRSGLEGSNDAGLELLDTILLAEGLTQIDYVVVGHSHFDHAIDVGPVAEATGAQVIGSVSTCLIAEGQGLEADRCTVVDQGDVLTLGEAEVTFVRTPHFLPESPIGLYGVLTEAPAPDQAGGAPNGGVLSPLFELGRGEGRASLWFQDSLGPLGSNDGSGEDYAANLEAVFDAPTTLWLGAASFVETEAELDAYLSRIEPRWVIPQHWDGSFPVVEGGLMEMFAPPDFLFAEIEAAGGEARPPTAYFERFVLDAGELSQTLDNPIYDALGQ